ncbi:hypothetical protein YPF_0712 [Yersinia pestis biovar Orientalis str. India 195]|nr:hypothetical protein YPF_0712 [Yersinia pestis biovar Orientalis str. India 195]
MKIDVNAIFLSVICLYRDIIFLFGNIAVLMAFIY